MVLVQYVAKCCPLCHYIPDNRPPCGKEACDPPGKVQRLDAEERQNQSSVKSVKWNSFTRSWVLRQNISAVCIREITCQVSLNTDLKKKKTCLCCISCIFKNFISSSMRSFWVSAGRKEMMMKKTHPQTSPLHFIHYWREWRSRRIGSIFKSEIFS